MNKSEDLDCTQIFTHAKSLEKQDLAAALKAYEQVLSFDSNHSLALNAAGRIAYQLGQPTQALTYWQKLVQLKATAKTWANIGSIQSHLNQLPEAKNSLTRAIILEPKLEQAHYQMALLLIKQQDFEFALQHVQLAWDRYAPKLAEAILQSALVLMQKKNYALAESYFDLSCQVDLTLSKRKDQIFALRANCALFINDSANAQQLFSQANQLAYHPLAYTWPQIAALPYIYQSQEHILATRNQFIQQFQHFEQAIDQAIKNKENLLPVLESACPAFLLSYQGFANVDLMRKTGQIFTRILNSQKRFIQCQHIAGTNQKIRVGFVSSFFYNHSITRCYGERIKHMAQQADFEVVCISLASRHDSKTEWLKENVQEFVSLSSPIKFQDILDLKLDILIYTDIGMEAKTYQLALHRLAPIQILVAGHPETSGLPEMDYFLSSLDPQAQAQRFYTETLISLKESFTLDHVFQEPQDILSRTEIGFEPDAHIYFCPMTLFKVHPDFDIAIGQILEKDPQGLVYFVQDSQPALAHALQARFQQTIPAHADRIHFLPWMDQTTFYSALLQADVVLDTFHFGGGTTSRIAFNLGIPIVCYPGEQHRARMTYIVYTQMGLEELVPNNQEEYIEQALKLASDPEYRQQFRSEIKTRYALFKQSNTQHNELYQVLHYMRKNHPKKITQIELERFLAKPD